MWVCAIRKSYANGENKCNSYSCFHFNSFAIANCYCAILERFPAN